MNPSRLGPTKLTLITGKEGNGIYCFSNFGPVFGETDLCISNDANTSASNSRLGYTYQLPPGQQKTFFTGAQNFRVTDYEVFGLQQCKTPAEKDLAVRIVRTQSVIDRMAISEFTGRASLIIPPFLSAGTFSASLHILALED